MDKDIKALIENNTWNVEELPPKKKLINYKWVFKVKYKSNGSIEVIKPVW